MRQALHNFLIESSRKNIVITRGQSEESYKAGFQLLKTTLTELAIPAFGGQGFPKFFLTDNSAAEMNALSSVWPESQNLLCQFHILQAVWRWLCDGSNASREERQMLLHSFREIMYATFTDLPTKYEEALPATENTKWKSYVGEYWLFKEKWILSYRDYSIRGNLCEVSVRIFKDNILSRVRAYNVIALIDFCCSALEKFYVNKFKDFSNSRKANARLFFSKMIRKSSYIQEKDIVRIDEDTFIVPSQSSNGTYTVNTDVGVCSCADGQFGRFCKQEAAIYKYYDNEITVLREEIEICRTYMAAVYVGECAVNVKKAIHRLPNSKQDDLFKYCQMDRTAIANLRQELEAHGDNRHCFAHLGEKEDPEKKN